MPQYRANASDFKLESTWRCTYYMEVDFWEDENGLSGWDETFFHTRTTPTTATHDVVFPISLPDKTKITGIRAHGLWTGSSHGIATRSINGVGVNESGYASLSIPSGNVSSISAEYRFKALQDKIGTHEDAATTAHQTYYHTSVCTIKEVFLLVDYEYTVSKCIEPDGVELAAATSAGQKVALSWNAGESGLDNTITHYEVARKLSEDGSTWGDLETVGTTTGLSMLVEAPGPMGAYYQYYVRTVGDEGAAWASPWAACADTLQKVHPTLVPYTDPTIVPYETPVKAVHMLELQTNINLMRVALGFEEYAFADMRAHYTSLGEWSERIKAMRAAIDEMASDHDAWLPLGANSPRADVIMQLRQVVAAI